MTIPDNIIIQLGLSILGTAFGSYLTAVLKLYLYAPPRIINWAIGVIFYGGMVLLGWLTFSPVMAMAYTCIIFGFNALYDKGLRKVWADVNRWHKKKGRM
jgi:hypothetical protein